MRFSSFVLVSASFTATWRRPQTRPGNHMSKICFLSGLEIPQGRISTDHYYPKCFLPPCLKGERANLFPAHKIINSIKGNLFPCAWEEQKFELVWHAIHEYNIRSKDKEFCRRALKNWEEYRLNPCYWCIMNQRCGK